MTASITNKNWCVQDNILQDMHHLPRPNKETSERVYKSNQDKERRREGGLDRDSE